MKKIILPFIILSILAGLAALHSAPAMAQFDTAVISVLDVQNEDLSDVCTRLAAESGRAVEAQDGVHRNITLYLEDMPLVDAVQIIADAQGLAYVTDVSSDGLPTYRFVTLENYKETQGRPFFSDRVSRIFTLDHITPSELVPHLAPVKSQSGSVYAYDLKKSLIVLDRADVMSEVLRIVGKADVAVEMKTFEFKNIPPEQLLTRVRGMLSPYAGRAEMHQASARVTVIDTPEVLAAIEELIRSVDNENRLIGMDTRIIQIVLSEEYHRGVDWPAIVANYKNMKFSGKSAAGLSEHFSVGTISYEDFQVLLESLDAVGIVQDISSQNQTLKNGETSDVAVKAVDLILKPDEEQNVERVEHSEAITFALTPSLTGPDTIGLQLVPQVEAFKERVWMDEFYTKSITRDFDASAQKDIIDVSVGETLVVGGLFKNVSVESTRSIIPFLGKIPLLGFAFRNQGRDVRRAEMILFLTPRFVENE